MSATAANPLMTAEEFLALPDDGIERVLIRGRLREQPMTRRNRRHSRVTSKLAQALQNWLDRQPLPRGEVLTGDAGFRLRRDPDTAVGVDVAFISADMAANIPDDVFLIDGAPSLAVEILSPSDKHEDITDKVREYLKSGVKLVWIVDPDFQTVTVHQAGAEPALFNRQHELSGGAVLAGFQVPVGELFA